MTKRSGAILLVLFAALFLFVNREAYRGYFHDDEFDTLGWVTYAPATEYLKTALTPRFQDNNFRPVGHFYFHAAEYFFGLDFPKYVAVLHLFHLLNAYLIWMLARRLGASPLSAGAACVFFAFHFALFDAYWKPLYVFDVLCATFCLLSILCYAHQRWILSFLAFWLAYKSKELAVMLPLVLACYEIWFGQRRWKPLVPFFLTSLSFGLQALLLNPNQESDYTFRFTLPALATTTAFYAGRVFPAPYVGFLLPLSAFLGRRRTWFGMAMMALFLLPLLFLPGRVFSAYCYLPFAGLALALAGMAEAVHPLCVALFFMAWIPLDLHSLRVQERANLANDVEVRTWFTTLYRFARTNPAVDAFVYGPAPAGLSRFGVEGAVKYAFKRFNIQLHYVSDPETPELRKTARVALLTWDGVTHKLTTEVSAPTAPRP